ncbi:MAG: aminoacyl-tRNA hydrolase [Patescibacteria group bacterium]
MKVIVGLGNPIPKYQGTRHNVGQAIVSYFQKINNFPKFQLNKKIESLISQGKINQEKIILVLPQTFMNESGRAVKKIIGNYKLKIENLIIIHDDIDLPLGKIRIRKNGSSGGHKGVQSIIDYLKTENFIRIKIGIRPNPEFKTQNTKPQLKIQNLKRFVLQRFSKEEKEIFKKVARKTCQTIKDSLKETIKNQTIVIPYCH